MVNAERFFTVLAWIFGLWSTLIVVAVIALACLQAMYPYKYGDNRYPIGFSLTVAIICWAWILTR